ncbi:hypothetical protein GCM10027088_12410 [Nocardia goodfellowii]
MTTATDSKVPWAPGDSVLAGSSDPGPLQAARTAAAAIHGTNRRTRCLDIVVITSQLDFHPTAVEIAVFTTPCVVTLRYRLRALSSHRAAVLIPARLRKLCSVSRRG